MTEITLLVLRPGRWFGYLQSGQVPNQSAAPRGTETTGSKTEREALVKKPEEEEEWGRGGKSRTCAAGKSTVWLQHEMGTMENKTG